MGGATHASFSAFSISVNASRRGLGVRALHLGDGALVQPGRQRRGIDRVAQAGEGEPGGGGGAREAQPGVGGRAERLGAGVSGH